MSSPSLSIAFLLGSPDINGGTYVIYEHGTRLQKFGHSVTMITEGKIDPVRYSWHPRAVELDWLTLVQATEEKFDIVLATWWQSPFLLHRLSASHYVYFVQSIESRFFEEEDTTDHDLRDLDVWKEYCESTYSLNLPVITEAQWIKDYLHDNYNRDAFLVRNGIRKDIYQSEGTATFSRTDGKLRILVEGPVDVFYKNVPKSIELCHQAGVDEIWLLTSSDVEIFPGVDRVFSRISIHETPDIYRSCDVLLKLSYIEGMFGPPLEMFHCGGTAIVYDVTGHDEYIVHGENSYVAAKDDEQQVVEYLKQLKRDPHELARLKAGACATAEAWPDWDSTSVLFEKALQQINRQPPGSRNYLKKRTEELTAGNKSKLNVREIERFQSRERDGAAQLDDKNNFIQLYYWAEKDGLNANDFCWAHYTSGEPVELSLDVPITGFPFWLRIDPSVRFGVISIDSITVKNLRTGDIEMAFDSPEKFDILYASGTLRRLEVPGQAIFLSHGYDPILILPAMNKGQIGDKLQITIRLEETGVGQFVNAYSSVVCSRSLAGNALPAKLNRLVGKLFGRKNHQSSSPKEL